MSPLKKDQAAEGWSRGGPSATNTEVLVFSITTCSSSPFVYALPCLANSTRLYQLQPYKTKKPDIVVFKPKSREKEINVKDTRD